MVHRWVSTNTDGTRWLSVLTDLPSHPGVILYIVLSGTPPFDDSTLFEQIRTATYAFDGEEWEGVSDEAKDLVRHLMTASPATRLKVDQVRERERASQSRSLLQTVCLNVCALRSHV